MNALTRTTHGHQAPTRLQPCSRTLVSLRNAPSSSSLSIARSNSNSSSSSSTAHTTSVEQQAAAPTKSEEDRFHEAYAQAYTMSQLYVKNRPEAVPLPEWEARRKKRDMADILEAARRRGKDTAAIQKNLEQLESILPNLIDLNKMKPADWVTLSEDVAGAANKLIILKTYYPAADVFSIMANRPKTLLQSEAAITENAKQVKALLSSAQDIDSIIQAVPELTDPPTLSRSLAFLASSFPGQNPVALLQENPQILLNLGESNVEDSAEYGDYE